MQYVEKKDGKYFYKITIPMIFFDREDSDWACDEICDFGTRNTPFYWTEETENKDKERKGLNEGSLKINKF